MAPNEAGSVFPNKLNPDFADVLGDTDFDFENFYFFVFLLGSPIPRFLDSQISRFLDFQIQAGYQPEIAGARLRDSSGP